MHPVHVLFDAEKARPILQELADCIPVVKASKSFNISRNLLGKLGETGVVSKWLEGNHKLGVPELYRSRDIENFLKQMNEKAKISYDPTRYLSISEASRRTKFLEIQIVNLILESKLQQVALSPFDIAFECIHVDPSEFCEKWVSRPLVEYDVVARWFFTTARNIEALANTRYFTSQASLGIHKSERQKIFVKELRDFSAKFEAISKLGRDRNQSVRSLRKHFETLKVKPAFTLPTGLSFYNKSDL